MKLKFFKTLQMLSVVVTFSALLSACNITVTEPLKLISGQGSDLSKTVARSDDASVFEKYGVPEAQKVLFSKDAGEELQDLTY